MFKSVPAFIKCVQHLLYACQSVLVLCDFVFLGAVSAVL